MVELIPIKHMIELYTKRYTYLHDEQKLLVSKFELKNK